MRPVNLIPPEDRRGEKAPLRSGPASYLIVAVLGVALLAVTLVVLTNNQITDRKTEVATLQSQVSAAQAQAKRLQSFADFAALQQARQETVSSLATSRFDWERVLRELAIVIPDDVWLTSMTASASGEASSSGSSTTSSGSSSTTTIEGPSLDIHGCATGHDAVAGFLAALRDVDGVTRVAVLSSDQPASDGGTSGTTATADGSGGTGCAARDFISTFEIVVAFDEAQPTAATDSSTETPGSTVSTPPTSTDSSQVSDGQQQLQQQKDSAAQATQRGRDAANTVVPGTGSMP